MSDDAKQKKLAELGRLRQRVVALEEELGVAGQPDPANPAGAADTTIGVTGDVSRLLSDLLSIHAPNGDYLYVSHNTERFFGRSREDVIGRNAYDFFHPDDLERIAGSHAQHEQQHEEAPNTIRYRIRQADGTYRWVETRSRARASREGVEHIVAVTRDIQETVESEEDLRQFTKVVSHDLRSPLVAVSNLVEWLQEDVGDQLDEESARHLELIGERVDYLRELLEDLLAYARVGMRGVERESVELERLIGDIRDVESIPDTFDIELETDVEAIETGLTPLRQVLVNLIQNAVKHHDQDSGEVVVEVSEEDGRLRFCVADDGPGIPGRYHDQVFEIFKTLTASNNGKGTGLGLALVDRIVSNAGGAVSVESPVANGRGTAFCFEWPTDWSVWEGRYE
jgi:PAS domain S-box-containing protein